MQAHRVRVMVPDTHEVTVRLPSDFPAGAAELIVVTTSGDAQRRESFDVWLDRLLAKVPAASVVPLEALRRENLYE